MDLEQPSQPTLPPNPEWSALCEEILEESRTMEGAMGAIAFAVLKMFRAGGMDEVSVHALHQKMEHFFMNPSNEECNAICKMLETRLASDKRQDNQLWYSQT